MSLLTASARQSARRSIVSSRPQPWAQTSALTLINTSFPGYTTQTLGATANTKTSWTEVISSLPAAVSAVYVRVGILWSSSVDPSTLLDIGVGASGSETAVASNIGIGGAGDSGFWIPIRIASGARVAMRCQSARTSFSHFPRVFFFSGTNPSGMPTAVDVIGTSSGNSQATALTGSSGSWTEIISATAKDYQSVVIVPSSSSTTAGSGNVILSLGAGASGSESVLGSGPWDWSSGIFLTAAIPTTISHSGPVAAGTRLAVRHNISANPGRWSVCLIGVPYV